VTALWSWRTLITTGTQAIHAARQVETAGAHVLAILAVIDREQGGTEKMARLATTSSTLPSHRIGDVMKDETEDRENRELPLEVLFSAWGSWCRDRENTGASTHFRDPVATDQIGRELAHRMKVLNPNVVCVWEEPTDMILGHVVARELGLRWVRCVNSDGLAAILGLLPRNPPSSVGQQRRARNPDDPGNPEPGCGSRGRPGRRRVLVGTEQLDEVASEVPAVVSLVRSAAS